MKTGTFEQFDSSKLPPPPTYRYYFEGHEHQDMTQVKQYLRDVRGLSDETIEFFIDQGVLAQATNQSKDGYSEPVAVFKSLDKDGKVIGASLQGILENKDRYERGRLKKIMYASDGMSGMHVDIGQPKRLVFSEAPIDLMSYYEANKDSLRDVRLVAMDGLKEATISRYYAELYAELTGREMDVPREKLGGLLAGLGKSTHFQNPEAAQRITLAVDYDQAAARFINNLRAKGISFQTDTPARIGFEKNDWNDELKIQKERVVVETKNIDENYKIRFEFSEKSNGLGLTGYRENQLIDYEEFASKLYQLNDDYSHKDNGYFKVYFDVVAPGGEIISNRIRYDLATEKQETGISEFLSESAHKSYLREIDNTIQNRLFSRDKEKALDQGQEQGNEGEFHRTSDFLGDKTPGTASQPVEQAQPDFPVVTQLHFTTNRLSMSNNRKPGYHSINEKELKRLNRFAPTLQSTAQWYLKEIANSDLSYFYKDKDGELKTLRVKFEDKNFAHLAGLSSPGVSSSEMLDRLSKGQGSFDNLIVSDALKDKLQVIPILPEIAEADSFIFNDLSEVAKLNNIDLSKAITPTDTELLLLFRDLDKEEALIPASLMKVKGALKMSLEQLEEREVLGVYRERNGQIEQLSINDKYVKDGGKEMFDILKNNELEPTYTPTVETKPRNVFDQGRDAVTDFLERMRARNRQKAEEEQLKAENKDSDLDGLSDKLEMGYGTNPHSADTDGDGLSDTQEVSQGTDPLEPNQATSQPTSAPQIVPAQPSLEALIDAKDTKGLSQHLKDGIKDYFSLDVYKNYLNAMSKMNNYSSNNLRLLVAQNPNVSAVASFNQWKELGRHIKKGEKGLKIWAPTKVKLKDDNGQPILDERGQEKTALRFFLTTVFDVSQTQGKDLPKQIYELTGDAQDFQDLFFSIKRAAEDKGVKVGWGELEKGNGYFDPEANQIMVKSGMSPAQTIKTVLHELVHSRLHADGSTDFDSAEYAKQELQAESIAYVVANHYNIDTSDYSFAYLASWSQSQEGLAEFEAQLSTIQKEAKSLMNEIDSKLEQIKNKSVAQDKFHEKLAQHKQEQATKQVPEASKEKAQDDPKKSHGL